jgi:hypothetical protein
VPVKVPSADQRVTAQAAAEYFWLVATRDDRTVSTYDTAYYITAKRAFIVAVRQAYGIGARRAERVYEALSAYGPYDTLSGTTGRGVESYVQFVVKYPREKVY